MPSNFPHVAMLTALLLLLPTAGQGVGPPARTAPADTSGDPLPPGAIARLGTQRLIHPFVESMVFSPDAKVLATGGARGTIRLWDVRTGKHLRQIMLPRARFWPPDCVMLEFSPDGKTLAAVGKDGSLRLCDLASGQPRDLLGRTNHGNTRIAFSPDSRRLAIGQGDGSIRVVDPDSGKALGAWKKFTAIAFFAFTSDSKNLILGTRGTQDKPTSAWYRCDASTGQQRQTWNVSIPDKYGSQLDPTGRCLAVPTEDDRAIVLFDPKSGKEGRRLTFTTGGIWKLTFSGDGRFLSAPSHTREVRVWEVATGKRVHQLHPISTPVQKCVLSRDGKLLAVVGQADDAIHIWDLERRKERPVFQGHRGGALKVAFTVDGKSLVTVSRDPSLTSPARYYADWSLRCWDVATGKHLSVIAGQHEGEVRWAAISPDANLVLTVTHQGTLRVWDVSAGREIRRWQVPTCVGTTGTFKYVSEAITSPVFSPDGKTILAGTETGVVHWETATGKTRMKDDPEVNRMWFHSIRAVSPDGKTRALAERKVVHLREERSNQERGQLKIPSLFISALAFSPDGKQLAVADGPGGDVRIYDPASGRQLYHFAGHWMHVHSLAFSPDGSKLASAGYDNVAFVWSLAAAPAAGLRREPRLLPGALKVLWSDLAGSDAARAYRAIRKLAESPKQAVPFLNEQLASALVPPDVKKMARLIADLDADQFEQRENASQELERLGRAPEDLLQQALDGKPSPELRQRAGRLLKRLEMLDLPSTGLIGVRVLEALEFAATPEARKALAAIAKGAPTNRLTQEARAALARLSARATAKP